MAALYLDEDYDPVVASRLRARGYNVVAAHEVGMVSVPDPDHLAHASREGLTLLTFNIRDYAPLHQQWLREGRTHEGIVVSRQYPRREIGQLLRLVENLLQLATEEDLAGRLRFLTEFDV